MKKIYSMLLLIVMLCSLSIVSASENLSTSDNPVVVDNVDMSSKNIGSIPDVTSASNDVVVSENSSVEWKSYENEKDDNVSDNQSNSSSNSTSNGSYKEESVVSNVVTKNVSSSYGTVVNYNIKVLDQFKKTNGW